MRLFLVVGAQYMTIRLQRSDCDDVSLPFNRVTGSDHIWEAKIGAAQRKSGGFVNPNKGFLMKVGSAVGIVTTKMFFKLGELRKEEWPCEDQRFEMDLSATGS